MQEKATILFVKNCCSLVHIKAASMQMITNKQTNKNTKENINLILS